MSRGNCTNPRQNFQTRMNEIRDMERERILQFTLEEENGKYYFDVASNSRLLFKSRLFQTKQEAKNVINYLAYLAVTDQEFVDNTSR